MVSAKAYLSVNTFERLYRPPSSARPGSRAGGSLAGSQTGSQTGSQMGSQAGSDDEGVMLPGEEGGGRKKTWTREELRRRKRQQKQFFAQLESHTLRKEKNLQQARALRNKPKAGHSPKINERSIRLVARARRRREAASQADVPVRYNPESGGAGKGGGRSPRPVSLTVSPAMRSSGKRWVISTPSRYYRYYNTHTFRRANPAHQHLFV